MYTNSMKFRLKKNVWLQTLKKLAKKTIPLWLALLIFFESTVGIALGEYVLLKRNFDNALISLTQSIKNPDDVVQLLKQQVLPQKGYVMGVVWKDIGVELLKTGAIDQQKYQQLLAEEPDSKAMMKYLNHASSDHMMVNEKNNHFLVNTLWALGLANKSKVLDEGQMQTYGQKDPMGYASTGGWDLGSKPASELYSSESLITLTSEQEALVQKIAATIYRPCCGNSVAFPDCNHGMAVLGYIELAVKQGLSEKRIYQDVLALNSFWFPQQYVSVAAYFKQQKTDWQKVDAKLALGADYSSGQGAARIQQAVQSVPGLQSKGGGCSA